jgi:hypothetical protein
MPHAIRNKSASQRAKSARKPESQADFAPFVRIHWTDQELASLAKLMDSEPAKPTDALIRLMKG